MAEWNQNNIDTIQICTCDGNYSFQEFSHICIPVPTWKNPISLSGAKDIPQRWFEGE